MDKNQVVEFIESHKAVAVLRLPSPDRYDQVEEALEFATAASCLKLTGVISIM